MEQTIESLTEGKSLTISLRGEIDHHGAVAVRGQIDEQLYAERPQTLVLDLGGVDFMDSAGLGLIMGRYHKTQEIGTELVLRDPSRRVEKMMKMAGLDKMIRVEYSQKGANS